MGLEKVLGDSPIAKGKSIFYLLVDDSGTMSEHIDTVNDVLGHVVADLQSETAAKLSAQLGVIAFSDRARTLLPAADITDDLKLPRLEKTEYQTNFAAAFDALRTDIARALQMNKKRQVDTHRAVVFFLTDGRPEPEDQPWREALRRLLHDDAKLRPKIFAFGIGKANEDILGEIATEDAWKFVDADRGTIAEALKTWAEVFVGTLVGTSSSTTLQKPQAPASARRLPLIPLD